MVFSWDLTGFCGAWDATELTSKASGIPACTLFFVRLKGIANEL